MKVKIAISLVLLVVLSAGTRPDAPVEWLTFEEALQLHRKTPKKLLIDLYTNWCGWCKKWIAKPTPIQTSAFINEIFIP